MTETASGSGWLERFRARGPWVLGFWIVGIASWLYLMIITEFALLEISVWSIPFLLLISAVSTPWRSVSFSTLWALFMVGVGPIVLLVVLSQGLLALSPAEEWTRSLFDSLADAGFETRIVFPSAVIFAPVLEEFFKVLPLVALVFWGRSRIRVHSGPIDYAVMAGATGAGFAFGEDILVYLNQGLPGPTSSVFAFNLGPAYQSLVGSRPGAFESDFTNAMGFFFPEMQYIGGVAWIGHGALALGLGLTIGLVIWGVRRFHNRWIYLAIPLVYLWVVWEHGMANWYSGAGCAQQDMVPCTIADVDLRGRIFPFVVLAGWGLAMYMSRRAIRSYRSRDGHLGKNVSSLDGYRSTGWRGYFRYANDWLEVRRWRRRAAYGVEHVESTKKLSQGDLTAMLAARLRGLEKSETLKGSEPEPLESDLQQLIVHYTPLD